ncbi:uridylate kinase [mine drainage metagenome]|uniref:Uridylate kinase n=1 Tax=mine drainage metagenome TaxID=410659 RepID=T1AXR0_9ZZZZ
MDKIVISLGGSVVYSKSLNVDFVEDFAFMLTSLSSLEKCGIVVGGGTVARDYIGPLSKKNVSNYYLDRVGIRATRLNAEVLLNLVNDCHKTVPETVDDAMILWNGKKFVVMGGTGPGHTTDTVAMLLAEAAGIHEFINGTSVDGVYSSDPTADSNATKYTKLSYDEALTLSLESYKKAGSNVFMDPISLIIARRAGIKIHVIKGDITRNYKEIIEGKKVWEP